MSANTQRTWTSHTATCRSCKATFRISQEALDEMKQEMEGTDAEAVAAFEFCLECTDGEVHVGEKVQQTVDGNTQQGVLPPLPVLRGARPS